MKETRDEEDMAGQSGLLRSNRVVVTGGAGFLGGDVTEKLTERGAADVFVPRKARLRPDSSGQQRAGGIGANHPNIAQI